MKKIGCRERQRELFLWKLEEEENGNPFESEQSNYYWFGFNYEGYLRVCARGVNLFLRPNLTWRQS